MILQRQFFPELEDHLVDLLQSWGLKDWTVVATDTLNAGVTRSIFLHKDGELILLFMLSSKLCKITLRDCPGWDSELLDRMYWLIVSDARELTYRLVSRDPLEIVQEEIVCGSETTSLSDPS